MSSCGTHEGFQSKTDYMQKSLDAMNFKLNVILFFMLIVPMIFKMYTKKS